MMHNTLPITPTQLQHDFTQLGVTAGDVVMLHASVKAVGRAWRATNDSAGVA